MTALIFICINQHHITLMWCCINPSGATTRIFLISSLVPWLLMPSLLVPPGGWINIKMQSYQYRKSHCEDKTILRPSYLHNGISYTGKKTTSLYWIKAQVINDQCTWYLLCRIIRSLCSMRKDYNCRCHSILEKWQKIQIYLCVS